MEHGITWYRVGWISVTVAMEHGITWYRVGWIPATAVEHGITWCRVGWISVTVAMHVIDRKRCWYNPTWADITFINCSHSLEWRHFLIYTCRKFYRKCAKVSGPRGNQNGSFRGNMDYKNWWSFLGNPLSQKKHGGH